MSTTVLWLCVLGTLCINSAFAGWCVIDSYDTNCVGNPTCSSHYVLASTWLCSLLPLKFGGTCEQTSCCPGYWGSTCSSVVTTCTSSQYQVLDATALTDRVCAPITTCTALQFQLAAPTATSDRICQVYSTCLATQYQSKPPTATSDRVCKNLVTCSTTSQFQSQAPTATSDRICSSLTACTSTQFQSLAATLTSDRVCTYATNCTSAQFQLQPVTSTSDRVCRALATCSSTEYQLVPPTPVADRVCSALLVCSATQFESVAPTETTDRQCTALSICSGSQYESAAATSTSNRVCSALTVCSTLTQYQSQPSTESSDRVCSAISSCSLSQYESAEPTSTSDRVCTPLTVCTSAQYQIQEPSAISDRICSALRVCSSSQYQTVAATATSDRVCAAISVCSSAQYQSTPATTTSDAVCLSRLECTSQQYQVSAGTSTTNRVCAALTTCTVSEFQSAAPTSTSNRQCTSVLQCGSSQYESGAPTATSNRICTALSVCSSSQWEQTAQTAVSDRQCTSLTTCLGIEIEVTAPTATSDRVCQVPGECTSSEFILTPATASTTRVCQALTVCNLATQYQSAPPTVTSDRVCTAILVCDLGTEYEVLKPTSTSNRVCQSLTTCASGLQYENVAATTTSNRQCASLSVCSATQFEATAPSATSDRLCSYVTNCTTSQFQSRPPSAVLDRLCQPVTQCDTATQFAAIAATATSDRVCLPLSICQSGAQYENPSATAVSDRVCHNLTTCGVQQFEQIASTRTSDRLCINVTVCNGAVQYESGAPSRTSDRICSYLTNCSGWQFISSPATAVSNRVCSSIRNCTAAQFQSIASTATSDRVCSSLAVCNALQFQLEAPTATTDRVCRALTICTSDQFETQAATATSNRLCQPTTTCTASQYESRAPTTISDRQCSPLRSCTSSEYESRAPTTTSDRICSTLTTCHSTEYISQQHTSTSDRQCSVVTICTGQDFEMVAPTTTSNRVCKRCEAWEYRVVSTTTCIAVTNCTSTQYEGAIPTTTSNRVCTEYDIPPTFLQTHYDWIVRGDQFPFPVAELQVQTQNNRSAELSVATVLTARNVELDNVGASHGFSWNGTTLSLSASLLTRFTLNDFPLRGTLRATHTTGPCITTSSRAPTPCHSDIAFRLDVGSFRPFCPSPIFVYSAESTQTVTWDLPRLWLSNGTEISLQRVDDGTSLFVTGALHQVEYVSSLTAISAQPVESLPSCSFPVGVRQGQTVTIGSIGHVFDSHSDRSAPLMQDFLVDAASLRKGGARLSAVSGSVVNSGRIAFGLSAGRNNFEVALPENHSAHFVVQLRWCAEGLFTEADANSLIRGSTRISVVGGAPVTEGASSTIVEQKDLVLTSTNSGITRDGRCFQIGATTSQSQESLAFFALEIEFTFSVPSLRRSVSYDSYQAQQFGGVGILYEPRSPRDVLSAWATPAVRAVDNKPPVFISFPEDIHLLAEPFQASAVVTWTEPVAWDNVGIASMRSSAPSGSTFSLEESPHTVTYTIVDRSGLTTVRVLRIYLDFPKTEFEGSLFIEPSNLTTSNATDAFGLTFLYDYVVPPRSSAFVVVDTRNYTALTTAISGSAAETFAIRKPTVRDLLSMRLEVNLAWTRTGSLSYAAFETNLTLYSSMHFYLNDVEVQSEGLAESFSSSSILTTFSENEYYSMAGQVEVTDTIVFDKIVVVLNLPTHEYPGSAPTGAEQYVLHHNSFVRVAYVYQDGLDAGESTEQRSGFFQVLDLEPPTFGSSCPSDFETELGDSETTSVEWTIPSAVDDMSIPEVISSGSLAPNQSQFGLGITPVTYTALDRFGNSAVCRFHVGVVDRQPPRISCPANITMNASTTQTQVPLSRLIYTVADNSGLPVVVIASYLNNTVSGQGVVYFNIGDHFETMMATDSSGNSANCTFRVHVVDVTAPFVTGCSDATFLGVSPDEHTGVRVNWTEPIAYDWDRNFISAPQVTNMPPNRVFPIGTTIVQYVWTDPSGNVAKCNMTTQVVATAAADGSSFSAVGVGVGVGIGLLVFIVVILLAIFMVRRTKRKALRRATDSFDLIMADLREFQTNQALKVPRELSREHVKILNELGTGNFGKVSKGILTESSNAPGYLVAIKVLHPHADRMELLKEAAVMAQFSNPFVLGLVGVVTLGDPLLVVIEFCEHGALHSYLSKHDIADSEKYQLAADCAEGLAFLASLNFVHRDVAARNVLLSSEHRAKISDFGMSREVIDANYYQSKGGQLPVRWTAPEALEHQKFSADSDCWSYGVLLFEIWSKASTPYEGMNNQKVWVEVASGYRLPCPDGCPDAVYEVMRECWAAVPTDRPKFTQLTQMFRALHSQHVAVADDPEPASLQEANAQGNLYKEDIGRSTSSLSPFVYMVPNVPVPSTADEKVAAVITVLPESESQGYSNPKAAALAAAEALASQGRKVMANTNYATRTRSRSRTVHAQSNQQTLTPDAIEISADPGRLSMRKSRAHTEPRTHNGPLAKSFESIVENDETTEDASGERTPQERHQTDSFTQKDLQEYYIATESLLSPPPPPNGRTSETLVTIADDESDYLQIYANQPPDAKFLNF
eukprot:m.869193 g.869193  ORF g.869193 m.869193 type:complete len:2559 (-) comp59742_c0_seq1:183-7859(-)